MVPHDIFDQSQLFGRQTVIRGQRHDRFQPEFGHPCRAGYMNVGSAFFPAVEKESIRSDLENGWGHDWSLWLNIPKIMKKST